MKQVFYKGRFIFIPIAVAACLSAVSFVVMQLWNHLLPEILHVGLITFWQAMGIFILCKILFGFGKGGRGFGGGGGNPWMRHKMEEKFRNMSPEQRESFKQKMGDRMCGPRGGRFGRFDWDQPAKEEPKQAE
ncbi:MAG: hypothetical protein V4592_26575 [Bacteroidota bacterium]